jgi:hypothetical protein
MKVEVYQLINDAQYKLSGQVMTMFMKKIDAMEPSHMGSRDLAFLFNLVKTAYQNPQVKEAAMVIYFNIAVLQKRGYSKEILSPSVDHLTDLIKNQDKTVKDQYCNFCLEIIGDELEERSSVNAQVILYEILRTYPKFYSSHAKNQKDYVIELVDKHDML